MSVLHSNGKSSIFEERLYSFFFALLHKKRKFRFFSFFLFFTITNEDIRFTSILYNLKSFHFVLFRFCKFFECTNSFYVRLWKCWAKSLRFTSFFQNFGTTWSFLLRNWQGKNSISFCFVLAKLKTKPTCFRFDLCISFVPFSLTLMNCFTKPIRFHFDLEKLYASTVRFTSIFNLSTNKTLFSLRSTQIKGKYCSFRFDIKGIWKILQQLQA
jgi:hypothetical protein